MTPAERARDQMVSALRSAGRLRDPAVEAALRAVPRHEFLPDLPVEEAYADEAVAVQRIGGVATSSASQPSMMAIMLEQLAARPGDRVLEIGAGTGYNAALLAHIVGAAGSVTSVDIDPDLVASAARHLDAAGAGDVRLVCADGALGWPADAPYDRIVLTVGSADLRPDWVDQLAPGGRLLLPLALRGSQLSVALDLGPDGLLRSHSVYGCAFIRLRGIGAGPETVRSVGSGCAMQVPEDAEELPDPAAVAAVLAAPGPVRAAGVPLGPLDVWDGFGLWLALREPHAVRLLCEDDVEPGDDDPTRAGSGPAAAMFPAGAGYAGPALLGPGPGLALAGPLEAGHRWPRPAGVHAFGPDGAGPAQRMLLALAAWAEAGRPRAADLQLVVSPRPAAGPGQPGAMIPLPHAVVTATWPGPIPAR
jgi:protein-L-isoaspartate(D-aspartate) O-methyltransferase